MTSEVVLMNRRAVALAADSATTSQYWTGKEWETRYFKGANKIFNLVDNHPVGLMTYDSANVQGAPWEVVAKAYRDSLGAKPKDNLSEYAASLCDFMAGNLHLFPMEYQEKQFVGLATTSAVIIIIAIQESPKFPKKGKKADRVAAAKKLLASHLKGVKSGPFIGDASAKTIEPLVSHHQTDVAASIEREDIYQANKDCLPLEDLSELGIWGVFSQGMPGLDKTELVVTGYGDREYFPSALQYTCYGPILGKVYLDEGKTHVVDQKNISAIVPLAKAEMIQTFAYGLGNKVRDKIDAELAKALDSFDDELRKQHGVKDDSEPLKEAARKQFSDAIVEYMYWSHVDKLRRAVAMLPIDELAELAETLILIESLKERVTGPSESVSRPIDVATISKGDGFIWIKRKHYFNRDLNPRYFAHLADWTGS